MTAVAVRYEIYFINTNKHDLCMGVNLNLIKHFVLASHLHN